MEQAEGHLPPKGHVRNYIHLYVVKVLYCHFFCEHFLYADLFSYLQSCYQETSSHFHRHRLERNYLHREKIDSLDGHIS